MAIKINSTGSTCVSLFNLMFNFPNVLSSKEIKFANSVCLFKSLPTSNNSAF